MASRFRPFSSHILSARHFHTVQGSCLASLRIWHLVKLTVCACGQQQTVNHVDNTCLLTKSEGQLQTLHDVLPTTHSVTQLVGDRSSREMIERLTVEYIVKVFLGDAVSVLCQPENVEHFVSGKCT